MYDDSDAISLRVQRLKRTPVLKRTGVLFFQIMLSEILIYSIN